MKFALTVQDARIALMAVHVVYVNDTLEFCYKKIAQSIKKNSFENCEPKQNHKVGVYFLPIPGGSNLYKGFVNALSPAIFTLP